ncbi:cytochrome c oxidase subunit 3 [Falsiroseomonas sp. HC035]|uniref:cytochrome c oxidase subunit 3 n=1 Tax=Falsiroseomonas sp. HC035 TaxID=3390999 RepID=UPI003D310FAD
MSAPDRSDAPEVVGDLSGLPDNLVDSRNLNSWGILGFMVIEGIGFALAAVVPLYLATQGAGWPPAGTPPPDIAFGLAFTLVLLASEWPNRRLAKQAEARDLPAMRRGMLLMTAIGLLLIGIRALELMHLNVRWYDSAYGSTIWLLMVLHTIHLVTDVGDTAVQLAWLYRGEVEDKQFGGAVDNCLYWDFVVLTWLPFYALAYWMPRFWGSGP